MGNEHADIIISVYKKENMEEIEKMSKEKVNQEPLPQIDATTGLNGWAGELSIKEEKMKGGNISNVPNPYVAFDFECLLFVPERNQKRVKLLEKFPIGFINKKSIPYYKHVPKAYGRLQELMRYAYNIAIVYVGPKHLWKQVEKMLELFPYTTLICVSDPTDFKEHITFNEQVLSYYTLSAIKAEQSGGKGTLFVDWDTLGMKIL